jgi:hypothetical protein
MLYVRNGAVLALRDLGVAGSGALRVPSGGFILMEGALEAACRRRRHLT